MTSMKRMKSKWFLAALLVGALAVGAVAWSGGSVLAQSRWPHGEQHQRPLDGATGYGPGHHGVQQERPHAEQH